LISRLATLGFSFNFSNYIFTLSNKSYTFGFGELFDGFYPILFIFVKNSSIYNMTRLKLYDVNE